MFYPWNSRQKTGRQLCSPWPVGKVASLLRNPPKHAPFHVCTIAHMRNISIFSFSEDTCLLTSFFFKKHLVIISWKTRGCIRAGSGAAAELLHVLCFVPKKELQHLGLTGTAVCGVTTKTASKPCIFNESDHTSHIPKQSTWSLKQTFKASLPKDHIERA